MEKIIILDEDSALCENLAIELGSFGCEVDVGKGVEEAQTLLSRGRYELVLAQAREDVSPEWVHQVRSTPGNPPLILLAEPASAERAFQLLGDGVCDVLVKPVSAGQVTAALKRARIHVRQAQVSQRHFDEEGVGGGEALVGVSDSLKSLLQLVRKVARTEATVLIHGEPGSGKRWVARELHRQSSRSDSPFLTFDCAAWPVNRVEAELFGEDVTVADGSVVRREGLIELCDGGTLLLKEIGELPLEAQALLLRFLKHRELSRVGGRAGSVTGVDVRLLATTTRQLDALVAAGGFNEELLFRLNIVPVFVPSLRDRKEDIPLMIDLIRHRVTRRVGVDVLAVSAGGLRALTAYDWPGNVRELEFTIERGVLQSEDGGVLEASHFGLPAAERGGGTDAGSEELEDLHQLEKKHIFLVLERCQGNRTHAARMLGISIRTLRNKLREYRETGEVACAPTLGGAPKQIRQAVGASQG